MKSILPLLDLMVLVLCSCQMPLSSPTKAGEASATFKVVGSTGAQVSDARLVVAENSSLNIGVLTNGTVDKTVAATKTSDSTGTYFTATVTTTVGEHKFVVSTYDSNGYLLTYGESTASMNAGNNTVVITLQPAYSLTLGKSILLKPNQLAYLTVSSSTTGSVAFTGSSVSLWLCTSDGGFSGPGATNTMTVALSAGTSKILRLAQGASAGSVTMTAPSWATIRQPDTTEEDGPAMTTDAFGNLYLSFTDNWPSGTTVEKFNGTIWSPVGAPHFNGGLNSLALFSAPMTTDPSGNLYIVSNLPSGVQVSKYVAPSWVTLTGLPTLTGTNQAIAFNASAGRVGVLASNATGTAYLEEYNGSTWTAIGSNPFSASGVLLTALAYDSAGVAYVAYQNSGAIFVVKFSGTWTPVGSSPAVSSAAAWSFALDSSGTPYIAYEANGGGYQANVVKLVSGSWVVVGTQNFSPNSADGISLAISGITPYVAFIDTGGLRTMTYNGSSWATVGTPYSSSGIIQDNVLVVSPTGVLYNTFGDGNVFYGQTVRSF